MSIVWSCLEKLATCPVMRISSAFICLASCRNLWLDEFLCRGIGLQTRRQYWFAGLADQVVFPHGILFIPRGFYIELPVFLANPTNSLVNWIRRHLSRKVCTVLIARRQASMSFHIMLEIYQQTDNQKCQFLFNVSYWNYIVLYRDNNIFLSELMINKIIYRKHK